MARVVVGNKKAPRVASPNTGAKVADDIQLTDDQHNGLREYILDRLKAHNGIRGARTDRFEIIDRSISGYLQRDKDDQARMRDNKLGYGVEPVDNILPLTFSQLDEAMTYMATVLAPDEGIYNAMAPREQQDAAKGFSRLMNQHAEQFNHYSAILRVIFDGLKYNEGALFVRWERLYGTRVVILESGKRTLTPNEEMYAGNKLFPIDMYNLIYDSSVFLPELNTDGEFFATVHMVTPFRLKKAEQDGKLWNVDRYIDSNPTWSFYQERPQVTNDNVFGNEGTNWISLLGGTESSDMSGIRALEQVVTRIWLSPAAYGLSGVKTMQIWEITMMNGAYITSAEQLANAHGQLPLCATHPIDDGFDVQTQSFGELLTPLNEFASFILNTTQRARRKDLVGGTTFYNENLFPQLKDKPEALSGGYVGMTSTTQEVDIRRHVLQLNSKVDITQTVAQLELVMKLMQQILPTDQLQQVAGLERATQYQAAATVQASSRRNLKMSKVANGQLMVPCRHMQFYNIMQYQQSVEIIDDETGDLMQINPMDWQEAHLEFKIADGLRGLDKTALILRSQELMNNLLQSSQAGNVDIVALINYITSLWGDHYDWSQFKIESPLDGMDLETKQLAFNLLQQYISEKSGGGADAPGGAVTPEAGVPTP